MSDVAEVKEALEHPWTYEAEHAGPVSSVIVDAARRWVRMAETGERVWLCRQGDRMRDWAHGPGKDPTCWFNGGRAHNPECGEYVVSAVVEAEAVVEVLVVSDETKGRDGMAVNWETCPVCYGGDVNCPDNCEPDEGGLVVSDVAEVKEALHYHDECKTYEAYREHVTDEELQKVLAAARRWVRVVSEEDLLKLESEAGRAHR